MYCCRYRTKPLHQKPRAVFQLLYRPGVSGVAGACCENCASCRRDQLTSNDPHLCRVWLFTGRNCCSDICFVFIEQKIQEHDRQAYVYAEDDVAVYHFVFLPLFLENIADPAGGGLPVPVRLDICAENIFEKEQAAVLHIYLFRQPAGDRLLRLPDVAR